MKRSILLGLLTVSLMSTAPGTARASASDAWITTKAKMTLLTTEGAAGTSIIREDRANAGDGAETMRASR